MNIEKIGKFHQSQIIFIREYAKFNMVLTISKSGQLFWWDIENRKLKNNN